VLVACTKPAADGASSSSNETADAAALARVKAQVAYANARGIEVGGYDLICLDRGHGGYGGDVGPQWDRVLADGSLGFGVFIGIIALAVLGFGAFGLFQAGDTLTRVNYRDLNTEELGSVYEGLLELHPQLERAGGGWQLSYGGGAGSDRKTTGSYYTPDSLVQLLIVSELLPVIADRLSKASTPEEKEQALLAIRVLDPACGSGHFLLAAARRLALELARIHAGDEEPSEELRQECLREVVAHCI
jgi:hypothetical protein